MNKLILNIVCLCFRGRNLNDSQGKGIIVLKLSIEYGKFHWESKILKGLMIGQSR
jgi:hypothetical protein